MEGTLGGSESRCLGDHSKACYPTEELVRTLPYSEAPGTHRCAAGAHIRRGEAISNELNRQFEVPLNVLQANEWSRLWLGPVEALPQVDQDHSRF